MNQIQIAKAALQRIVDFAPGSCEAGFAKEALNAMNTAKTLDGVEIEVGKTVWVLAGDSILDKKPETRIVKEILSSRKGILLNSKFEEEEWRLDVYSTKIAAEEAWRKQVVILHLDKEDAHVILYALSRRMREVEADLSILLISRARDLTLAEKAMLPPQLLETDDDELLGHKLREQINPWISLRDHIAFLIKQIEGQIIPKEQINLRCDLRCDLCSRGHNGFSCDDSIEKPTPPPNVTIREGSTKEIPVKE